MGYPIKYRPVGEDWSEDNSSSWSEEHVAKVGKDWLNEETYPKMLLVKEGVLIERIVAMAPGAGRGHPEYIFVINHDNFLTLLCSKNALVSKVAIFWMKENGVVT